MAILRIFNKQHVAHFRANITNNSNTNNDDNNSNHIYPEDDVYDKICTTLYPFIEPQKP